MDILVMFGSVAVGIIVLILWVAYVAAPPLWLMTKTTNPIAVFCTFLFTASSGVTGLVQFIQWVKLP